MNLEKVGAQKGEKNQPSAESQIPDEIETQIQERIEAAKSTANESAENQIHSYNERISNLDFEGHFSELRQAGPIAIRVVSKFQLLTHGSRVTKFTYACLDVPQTQ